MVVLCKKHHDMVHYGNLKICGWKETVNSGKVLDYHLLEKKKIVKKKKYDNMQVKIVISLKYKVCKTKQAKQILENELGFNSISELTIKKMWDDKY